MVESEISVDLDGAEGISDGLPAPFINFHVFFDIDEQLVNSRTLVNIVSVR